MALERTHFQVFTVFILFLFSFACTVVWQDYTPKSGAFTVSLPCSPSTSSSFERTSSTSSVTSTIFKCEPKPWKKTPYLYISTAKYSSWSMGKTQWNDEKMFKGFIEGFQKHVKSTVKQQSDSEVAGIYAREFLMTTEEGGDVIIRVFRNNNTVYALGIYDKPGKDISSDAQSFFDSFVLNEETK